MHVSQLHCPQAPSRWPCRSRSGPKDGAESQVEPRLYSGRLPGLALRWSAPSDSLAVTRGYPISEVDLSWIGPQSG